jgi:hypothetical protein
MSFGKGKGLFPKSHVVKEVRLGRRDIGDVICLLLNCQVFHYKRQIGTMPSNKHRWKTS